MCHKHIKQDHNTCCTKENHTLSVANTKKNRIIYEAFILKHNKEDHELSTLYKTCK